MANKMSNDTEFIKKGLQQISEDLHILWVHQDVNLDVETYAKIESALLETESKIDTLLSLYSERKSTGVKDAEAKNKSI